MSEKMQLEPIGFVRCGVSERKAMPALGLPARIELLPEYAPGLLRMEKHSHIWVLVWLDRSERDVLQVTPRGVADRSPAGLHGVFAVRSPVRPNPIGLTVTPLLKVEQNVLEVGRLDFLEGTPVIDIKPYFASRDLVFSALNRQIGRPASREALRESLLMQAVAFHGKLTGDVALGVRILEHFRAEVLNFEEPAQWDVETPLERPQLTDAIMGVTHATLGSGALRLTARQMVRFREGGNAFEYELVAEEGNKAEVILEAPDADLFEFETYGLLGA